MNYTPGPWEIQSVTVYTNYQTYRIGPSPDKIIAAASSQGDARLMAAAPEIYEALKQIEEWSSHWVGSRIHDLAKRIIKKIEEDGVMAIKGRGGNRA